MAIDGKEGREGAALLFFVGGQRAGPGSGVVCMVVQAGSREFPILRIEKSVK